MAHVKSLPPSGGTVNLSNENKLLFYALFKQITEGENKTKQPGITKIVDRYKWDAWKKLGKMSKEDAMRQYVEALNSVIPNWDNPKPKL